MRRTLLATTAAAVLLAAACSDGGSGTVETPGDGQPASTQTPGASPAPTPADSPEEQALARYLADVVPDDTGATPEWYDAITDLELVGDTVRVSTDIVPDARGQEVARTICGALLYTNVVPFEQVLVHDGSGVLAHQCSR